MVAVDCKKLWGFRTAAVYFSLIKTGFKKSWWVNFAYRINLIAWYPVKPFENLEGNWFQTFKTLSTGERMTAKFSWIILTFTPVFSNSILFPISMIFSSRHKWRNLRSGYICTQMDLLLVCLLYSSKGRFLLFLLHSYASLFSSFSLVLKMVPRIWPFFGVYIKNNFEVS